MNRIFTIGSGLAAALLLSTAAFGAEHGKHATAAPDALPISDTVTASDCWVRQLPAPAPSGGFLVLHNTGSQDAELTGVHAADYGQSMMHQTTEENGMSKMSMVHEVIVPANGDLVFKPGGYHLMLEQARDGLKTGDHVQVAFTLADGHQVTVQCELRSPKAMSSDSDDHQHHMHH